MDEKKPNNKVKSKQNSNLSLIIILVILIIIIASLTITIIILKINSVENTSNALGSDSTLNSNSDSESTSSSEDESEPVASDIIISKEASSLDCTYEMTAEEAAALGGSSGEIEIVASFYSDDSMANIQLYKTINKPSSNTEDPTVSSNEFLVENKTAIIDELDSSDLPSYYLSEGNTEKAKAKSIWASQGFICVE